MVPRATFHVYYIKSAKCTFNTRELQATCQHAVFVIADTVVVHMHVCWLDAIENKGVEDRDVAGNRCADMQRPCMRKQDRNVRTRVADNGTCGTKPSVLFIHTDRGSGRSTAKEAPRHVI